MVYHRNVPDHTLTLNNSASEKGAVARSPFHVQFISASTTEPVKRSPVGLRVASASVALIVLRALAALRFDIDYPRFRPENLYLRTIHMRGRQATKCCLQACRKSTRSPWLQYYLYAHVSHAPLATLKNHSNAIFFVSRTATTFGHYLRSGSPAVQVRC